MIEAIVFDFDGVILDTETPDFETWQHEFRAHGVEFERSLWTGFIGGSSAWFSVPEHLAELAGRAIDPERIEARRRGYLSLIESSPILPGVTEHLVQARELGLKVGLASSSSRSWVEGHLKSRGLYGHFHSIRTRDDVADVKPDPELYLSAAEDLDVSPEACLAIEDSYNGVTSAKRAGMLCVVVPNPMTADMDLSGADLRLESLADLPLAELLDRASRSEAT
jgi:HAD superfamily hydrolase (TIGR01509 family)